MAPHLRHEMEKIHRWKTEMEMEISKYRTEVCKLKKALDQQRCLIHSLRNDRDILQEKVESNDAALSEMDNQMRSAEVRNKFMESGLVSLEKSVEKQEAFVGIAQKHKSRVEDGLSDLENKFISLQNHHVNLIGDRDGLIAKLQEKLTEAENVEAVLKRDLFNTAEKLSEKSELAENLAKEIEKEHSEVINLNRQINDKEDIIDNKDRAIDNLRSVHAAEEKIYQVRIVELNQVVDENVSKIKDLSKLWQESKAACADLQKTLVLERESNSELKNKIFNLEEMQKEKERELAQAEKTFQAELKDKQNELESRDKEVEKVSSELKKARDENVRLEKVKESNLKGIKALEEENEDLRQVQIKFKSLRDDLETILKEKESDAQEIQKLRQIQLQKLEVDEINDKLKMEIRGFQGKTTEADYLLKQSESTIADLSKKVLAMESENESLVKLNRKFQDSQKNVNEENEAFRDKVETLKTLICQKDKEFASYKNDVDDINTDMERKFQEVIKTLEAEVTNLKEELKAKAKEAKTNAAQKESESKKGLTEKALREEARSKKASREEARNKEQTKLVEENQQTDLFNVSAMSSEEDDYSSIASRPSDAFGNRKKRTLDVTDGGDLFDQFINSKPKQLKTYQRGNKFNFFKSKNTRK